MNKNLKFKTKNFQSGFTLIEAVVATALFAFVVSSILGVYVSTIQLDRKTRAQRSVAQNARFITDFFAKEVRNGVIDYSGSTCTNSATTFCLINQGSLSEKFTWNGADTLVLNKNGSTTNLNTSSAKVTKLTFWVAPAGNPYTSAKTYNEQPHVTIILELTSNYGNKPTDVAKLNLEESFATRNYPSRK